MTDRERADRLERPLRIVLRILWQEGYTQLSRQVHRELREVRTRCGPCQHFYRSEPAAPNGSSQAGVLFREL